MIDSRKERKTMKTLRRGISYNVACSILEANYYGIARINHSFKYEWTAFYDHNDKLVARYHEPSGRLQVKE